MKHKTAKRDPLTWSDSQKDAVAELLQPTGLGVSATPKNGKRKGKRMRRKASIVRTYYVSTLAEVMVNPPADATEVEYDRSGNVRTIYKRVQ